MQSAESFSANSAREKGPALSKNPGCCIQECTFLHRSHTQPWMKQALSPRQRLSPRNLDLVNARLRHSTADAVPESFMKRRPSYRGDIGSPSRKIHRHQGRPISPTIRKDSVTRRNTEPADRQRLSRSRTTRYPVRPTAKSEFRRRAKPEPLQLVVIFVLQRKGVVEAQRTER